MKKIVIFSIILSLIILVLVTPLVLAPDSDDDGIPDSERNALTELYTSTNGDNWINNDGWKEPPLHSDGFAMPGTECSWAGVKCDVSGNHVLEIWLGSNNLNGTTPASLANLINLRYLSLERNLLTGSIPPELGSLGNLLHLRLYSNQLTGSIPPELGNLGNLISLYLDNNKLSGSIPPELGNLGNLQALILYSNQLNGSIPPELGNLGNLSIFSLFNNQLTGSIPPELGNLGNLQDIALHYNQLTGSIPPELSNLGSLIALQLHRNQLTGSIPPELGNMNGLTRLYLNHNQLSGNIPPEIGNMENLQYIYLYGNLLTGPIPTELTNLLNLVNYKSDFRWLGLYTSNDDLRAFLNTKQVGGIWESTQTIAPTDLTAGTPTTTSVPLSWTAITYTGNSYEVYYTTTSGGPYTLFETITDRTVESTTVTGLTPGTNYFFSLRTVTNPHAYNWNTLYSEYSDEVSATTISLDIDTDGDGVLDSEDNCPAVYNPYQEDNDADGIGDVCDDDIDGDGVNNTEDNCPYVNSTNFNDGDSDGIGDVCDNCPLDPDNDADGDSVCGDVDNCPDVPNPDQADSESTRNIISYWKFDEGSGTTAYDSVGENHGTITGAFWTENSISGSALIFDWNDYVKILASSSLNTNYPLTWEAWINPYGHMGWNCILESNNGTHIGAHFYIHRGVHPMYAGTDSLYANLIDTSGNDHKISFSDIITSDHWQHVALTYNGTTSKLFYNGVEKTAQDFAADLRTAYDFYIGSRVFVIEPYFTGRIDEVAIYHKALPAGEIQQHYQAGLAGHGYLGDGIGDVCDPDDDNDGVLDVDDNCQFDYNSGQENNDNDSLGDVCDPDDDNDGFLDVDDKCPFTASINNKDYDDDGRGDVCDNCPLHDNPSQQDSNHDGTGDACDCSDGFKGPNEGGIDCGGSCEFSCVIPVLLIPGKMTDDPYARWETMEGWLEGGGFETHIIELEPVGKKASGDIKGYGEKLRDKINDIKAETNARSVDIVAHSMGGLVSRWSLKDPGTAGNVRKLITIGTPNHGSKLCELVATILPDWLASWGMGTSGYQQIPNSDFLNTLNCGSISDCTKDIIPTDVEHRTIAGTKVWGKMVVLQVLLPFLPILLPGEDDGIVTVSSSKLDGVVQSTDHKHHIELVGAFSVYNKVKEILKDNQGVLQGESTLTLQGETNPTELFLEQEISTPIQEAQTQQAPLISDTIYPSQEKSHDVLVDSVSKLQFTLLWQGSEMNFTLLTPNGTLINPSTQNITYLEDDRIKAYKLQYPQSGNWTLNVFGVDVPDEGENYTIFTFLETDLILSIELNKHHYKPDEHINLTANLIDGGTPLTGAYVIAGITKPDGSKDNIILYDDGTHNDPTPNDGSYNGIYTNTNIEGRYDVTASASGLRNNEPFNRESFVHVCWVNQYADLTVSDISFSNTMPVVGDSISINAVIDNVGSKDAFNATVEFYDGVSGNGRLIGTDSVDINSSGTGTASVLWNNISGGFYNIFVLISPFNAFLERDYSNNHANKSIMVGDGDEIEDVDDNCPNLYNPEQLDSDNDGIGDACDNCPSVTNSYQTDLDRDGIGDVCDNDNDNDDVNDYEDNCLLIYNPYQEDSDEDSVGDVCDDDIDGDGVNNTEDNCPLVANQDQLDTDGDNIGDVCDNCHDTDGDGWGDPGFPQNTCLNDNCPTIVNPDQTDTDGDGIGDVCDNCPLDPLNDEDSDGVCGDIDKCGSDIPENPWNATQELKPNHYDSSNWPASDANYGCSCAQVLYCKPGSNNGEYKFGCSQGTKDIWEAQDPDSWAPDCQDENGVVVMEGISKSLFENTDGEGWPDMFDGDNDGDGVPDNQDDMIEDSDLPGDPDYGIPDWHPKSKHKT